MMPDRKPERELWKRECGGGSVGEKRGLLPLKELTLAGALATGPLQEAFESSHDFGQNFAVLKFYFRKLRCRTGAWPRPAPFCCLPLW